MIRFISHQEIDKNKWDNCIENASNGFIYAFSWYLDCVAPNWNALVLNDYEAVMPLPTARKFFLVAYQPFFAQQLGIFNVQQLGTFGISDFIEAIPSEYKYINICLNENNDTGSGEYRIIKRNNFILYLHHDYEYLYKHFNEHNRRNIRKSLNNGLSIVEATTDEVVDFYVKHKGDLTNHIKQHHYISFKQVLNESKKRGLSFSLKVVNNKGETHSCATFYKFKNRVIFQIGTANEVGRESRAMFFMFNHIIEKYATQNLILDFEGSEIVTVSRFFSGFGALHMPYFRLIINNLPWPLKWLKQ